MSDLGPQAQVALDQVLGARVADPIPASPTAPASATVLAATTAAVKEQAMVRPELAPPPLLMDSDNVHDLWRLAKYLSESGLHPGALIGKPYNVLHLILVGKDRGMRPLQALQGMHIIEGRAEIGSHAMVALCLNSPACEYLYALDEECDATRAVYVARRRGWPAGRESRFEYTVDDAAQAGLLDKGRDATAKSNNNWRKMTKTMLRRRAASNICREVFPDVVMGMYDHGEIREFIDVEEATPATSPSRVAAEATSLAEAAVAELDAAKADPLAARMAARAAAGRATPARKAAAKTIDIEEVEVACRSCGTPCGTARVGPGGDKPLRVCDACEDGR